MAARLQYTSEQKHFSHWGSPVWMGSSPLVNCFLKSETSVQGAGLSVSLRKCKNILWSLCQPPPPPPLSPLQHHRPAVAGLPTGVEWVGELCSPPPCLYTAVFGLATEFYHTRVHVVIQSGKNFPECLEKPETLNGFQGLLMWLCAGNSSTSINSFRQETGLKW